MLSTAQKYECFKSSRVVQEVLTLFQLLCSSRRTFKAMSDTFAPEFFSQLTSWAAGTGTTTRYAAVNLLSQFRINPGHLELFHNLASSNTPELSVLPCAALARDHDNFVAKVDPANFADLVGKLAQWTYGNDDCNVPNLLAAIHFVLNSQPGLRKSLVEDADLNLVPGLIWFSAKALWFREGWYSADDDEDAAIAEAKCKDKELREKLVYWALSSILACRGLVDLASDPDFHILLETTKAIHDRPALFSSRVCDAAAQLDSLSSSADDIEPSFGDDGLHVPPPLAPVRGASTSSASSHEPKAKKQSKSKSSRPAAASRGATATRSSSGNESGAATASATPAVVEVSLLYVCVERFSRVHCFRRGSSVYMVETVRYWYC
jgi:hypothetical protein